MTKASYILITIKRDTETTLKQIASIIKAIEKQFHLFVSRKHNNAKKPDIILNTFEYNTTLKAELICKVESELFEEDEDIHRQFVSYCNDIVNMVLNQDDDTDTIAPSELDNFSKIVDFANDGREIVVSYNIRRSNGQSDTISETHIDIGDIDDEGCIRVSRSSISSVSKSRKKDLIVELKDVELSFRWQSFDFTSNTACIAFNSVYIEGRKLNKLFCKADVRDGIKTSLVKYNDSQDIEWHVCQPKIKADIKLISRNFIESDEYEVDDITIKEVLMHDIKDGEATLFNQGTQEIFHQSIEPITAPDLIVA